MVDKLEGKRWEWRAGGQFALKYESEVQRK
jgi:hypothetical protein